MMHNPYRDMLDGTFIPDIVVSKLPENGHFKASSCGLEATHHDSATAVNKLQQKLQDALATGDLHSPDSV